MSFFPAFLENLRIYPSRGDTTVEWTTDYLWSLLTFTSAGVGVILFGLILRLGFSCYNLSQKRKEKRVGVPSHPKELHSAVPACLVMMCVIIISTVIGFILGNVAVASGVNGTISVAFTSLHNLTSIAGNVTDDIAYLGLSNNINQTQQTVAQAELYSKFAEDLIQNSESMRSTLLILVIIFSSLSILIIVASAASCNHIIVSSLLPLLVLTLIGLGLNLIFYIPLSVGLDDTCEGLDLYFQNNTNPSNPFTSLVLQCQTSANQLLTDNVGDIFPGIEHDLILLNQITNSTLGLTFDPSIPTTGTFVYNLEGTMNVVHNIVILVENRLKTATQKQVEIVKPFLERAKIVENIGEQVLLVSSCQFIDFALENSQEFLCRNIREGSAFIFFVAAIYIVTSVVIIGLAAYMWTRSGLYPASWRANTLRTCLVQLCLAVTGIFWFTMALDDVVLRQEFLACSVLLAISALLGLVAIPTQRWILIVLAGIGQSIVIFLVAPFIAVNIATVGPGVDNMNIPFQIGGYFQSLFMIFFLISAFFGAVYSWGWVAKTRQIMVDKRQIQDLSGETVKLLNSKQETYSEL